MTKKSLKDKIIDFSRRIVLLEENSKQKQIQELENLAKIKKAQENELLVNNILDKISTINHSDLVEKKVEIRKRGLN